MGPGKKEASSLRLRACMRRAAYKREAHTVAGSQPCGSLAHACRRVLWAHPERWLSHASTNAFSPEVSSGDGSCCIRDPMRSGEEGVLVVSRKGVRRKACRRCSNCRHCSSGPDDTPQRDQAEGVRRVPTQARSFTSSIRGEAVHGRWSRR